MLPLSVAFDVLFRFPFSLVTIESRITCLCFVRERTDGWGMVQKVVCFLLQADLVPEHVCMYFFICFRDQDLISPGQTGTIVCEDCCCCWATVLLACWLQGWWLHLRCFFPCRFFLKMTMLGLAVTSFGGSLSFQASWTVSGCRFKLLFAGCLSGGFLL